VTSAGGGCDAEVVELDVAQYGGPRTATPGELTAPTPGELTAPTPGEQTAEPRWWQRALRRVLPPPEAIPDQHHELTQQLAVLEGARAELEAGWVQGSWWTVTAGGDQDHVDGVCLVGALVRAGARRNSGTSGTSENASTGRAVDAVYDALWASRGQPALTPQLVPSPQVRLARVRMLTRWNDHPGRTKAEVMTVIDRTISATILTLMATPPETATPETATPEAANR
jgi:hypothetical protein